MADGAARTTHAHSGAGIAASARVVLTVEMPAGTPQHGLGDLTGRRHQRVLASGPP
jgi:hypothetical protein